MNRHQGAARLPVAAVSPVVATPSPRSVVAPLAPSHAIEWPSLRDPRIPFAVLLTLYGVLGATVLGFNRSPAQMLATVLGGALLDVALARVLRGRWTVPLSAYITCCSLALLLNYSHSYWHLALPVYLAVGSKYVLTFRGRHVFNPSMFGVAVSLLVADDWITAAPAYQWVGGPTAQLALSAFLVMAALALFLFRVGRGPLIVSFLCFYAAQTALRAWIMRHHLPPQTLFVGTLTAPSFFLFVFYMLTDPATSPKTPRGQVLFAFAIATVDLILHAKQSVFTFFYAALTCGTVKFLFLHARALWTEGASGYLRASLRPAVVRAFAVVGALGAAVAGGRHAALAAGTLGHPLGFRMERLGPAQTGIHTEMSNVLREVDPRVAHIAKWVLSVGDAVAVGDYDGDGRLDLFLTNALKRPADRAALYRNTGDFRFERVPLAPMDQIAQRYRDEGLASGGAFADYDGDGDQDLAVAMSFGRTRLLRNMLRESGRAEFVDATRAAGIDEYTTSLAVTFLDYDRDGVLDLLVTNATTPVLPDYPRPTPFNIFHLPQPEYPGDRRMFHFMHNGWHNADNGGRNALYRGRGDGTFQKQDIRAMGMPETHWTLAAATGDFNRDGYTDLYLASDFGPDDLYLNEGGRHFRRVEGRDFGEIGRDTYKGMNVTVADFDRNGWSDVYVSNVHHALQAEGSLLWMVGPGDDPFVPRFTDEATARNALNEHRFGWGAAAGDLDLDGWPDLVQANGMVDDRLDHLYDSGRKDYWYVNHKLMQSGPDTHTYADAWGDIRGRTIYPNEARRAYLNRGDERPGEFVDVARELGIDDPDNSRGVLLADLDDDGDLDLVVTNQHGPVSVYRNSRRHPGQGAVDGANFVGIALRGTGPTHPSAIGSRVVVGYTVAGRRIEQVQELGVMGGLSAQAEPRMLFGLGNFAGPVDVAVHWYGGGVSHTRVAANAYHALVRPGAALAEVAR